MRRQKIGGVAHTETSTEAPAEAEPTTEAAHEHSWVEGEEIDPTCTEPGSIEYTCECGETKTEEIPAPGHDWDEDSDPVTCKVCGEEKPKAEPKEEKKRSGNTKNNRDGNTDVLSMSGSWPASGDDTYVMADTEDKQYRIDYKRQAPQNIVLVVDVLDFGSVIYNLPTDGTQVITEAKELDDHRFAVRLANVSNEMGFYFTFRTKHVALSAAEAATLIDDYNTDAAKTSLAVTEYELDPGEALSNVLTAGTPTGAAYELWSGKPYYNSNYDTDNHPITIKNPETDLYKVDVTPLSTSDAPMTNWTLDRVGYWNSGNPISNGDWYNGEPRIRLTEAYQKTDDLDGSLLEIEKIRLYAPSNKMKLRALGNTPTFSNYRGGVRALDGSDFTEQWGGWTIDGGPDGNGYEDPDKKVTVTNPDGSVTYENARYFDVTPPSRWFNRSSVGLSEFLGGMVTTWNLIDADDPLAAGTDYIVPEGMIVYYRLPGDSADSPRAAKFPGPEIKTFLVKQRTPYRKVVGMNGSAISRLWNTVSDAGHNVAVGSLQRNEIFYQLNNGSCMMKDANGVRTHYLPAELGAVTQTFTFPYQIQPVKMDLNGYCQSGVFNELPGSELASISYTVYGSTEEHTVDQAVIDSMNDVLSSRSKVNTLGSVAFGADVHVKTLTITWNRLAHEPWAIRDTRYDEGSEGVFFTYRVNDWVDETETEKLDLSVVANKWVQVEYEEEFSSTSTSPDFRPSVVDPYYYSTERRSLGRKEQGLWFRLNPAVCPDLFVMGQDFSKNGKHIRNELDNGNCGIGAVGFYIEDYGQRRSTIENPTIELGLTWESQPEWILSYNLWEPGSEGYKRCGLDGIELSDLIFFLDGSFKAVDKLFNTKENKGWTFTYDVFNGETKEEYQKTYTVKADDIGQTINLLEENEYFTSLSLHYDGAADVSHTSEDDTDKYKWLMTDIGVRRLNTNPRDGRTISVSEDYLTALLCLTAKVSFDDCTCSDHKHCTNTSHDAHQGTVKWQDSKIYMDGQVPLYPYVPVYKTRKASMEFTGSLNTTAMQVINQGGSTAASYDLKDTITTMSPLIYMTMAQHGLVFHQWVSGHSPWGSAWGAENYTPVQYPWGEINEAAYIELTDPEFIPDLANTTFCGYSCDPGQGKVISETVITADGKTFLKLRLADGVKRRDSAGGSVTENLKLAFNTVPGTSGGRHYPVGDIYWDIAGLLDHYRAGDLDGEGNRITTGYDRERTKYVFTNAVEDPYAGTDDALSPWTADGLADEKLFKYDGSGFTVQVEVAQSVGASLAPGKNYGNYVTAADQPRTVTFYPGEEDDLNGLVTLIGPSPNDNTLHDFEAYVTLPRIGRDIEWSEYVTEGGEPVLVDHTQTNDELSLYLRSKVALLTNESGLNYTIGYTFSDTPGVGADYVASNQIPAGGWRDITGIKIWIEECPPETALNLRLNLECDGKDNTDVLTAYAGGEYRYKESANGSFQEPSNLQLSAWKYENIQLKSGSVFWDVYDENGVRTVKSGNTYQTGETLISGVKAYLYDKDGNIIQQSVNGTMQDYVETGSDGKFPTLLTNKAEAGQYILIENPTAEDGSTVKLTKKNNTLPGQSDVDSDFDRETNKLTLGKLTSSGMTNISAGFVKLPQIEVPDIRMNKGDTADLSATVTEFLRSKLPEGSYNVSFSGAKNSGVAVIGGDDNEGVNAVLTDDDADDQPQVIPITGTSHDALVDAVEAKGYGTTTATATITNELGDEVKVTFKIIVNEKEKIVAKKLWDDDNDRDGIRPTSVSVQLKAGTENVGEAITLDGDNEWTYTWDDLDRYDDDGNEIDYSVVEEEIPVPDGHATGYTASYEKGNYDATLGGYAIRVKNKHVPETVKLKVNKDWNDNDDQDGIRPESVSIQLKAGDADTGEPVTLNEDNEWTYTWTDLYRYEDGTEIDYSVVEEEIPVPDGHAAGYEASYEKSDYDATFGGYKIIVKNRHEPESEELTVTKVWKDGDNISGKRPESVKFTLTGSDDSTYEATLSAPDDDPDANTWTAKVEVSKYHDKGTPVTFTIDEEDVDKYDKEIDNEKLSITNTLPVTITYKLNGGNYEGSTDDIVETYPVGTKISIHEAPKRTGYTFDYWEGSRYMPGDEYTAVEDHVFVAQWIKETEPTTQPNEPTTKPDEPTTQPNEPTTKPDEPTTQPDDPDEPTSTDSKDPQKSNRSRTGDNSPLAMGILLLITSMTAVVGVTVYRRRRITGR